jgi:hypothetical protein
MYQLVWHPGAKSLGYTYTPLLCSIYYIEKTA